MQPVSLITGASAGIGVALARIFAAHGHQIVVTARREAQLTALADEITAAGHKRPHITIADLAARDGPQRLADELVRHGLEPVIVVNNAGFGLLGDAAALDHAEQLAMIDLNVRALTDLSLRWIDSIKRHRGGILNVASIAAFMPGPNMAVYHATKAYVLSLSEALHQELETDGVRVCALCPGPVPTEFLDRAGIPDDYFPAILGRSAERVARAGYEGLMAGHRVVVPGSHNRVFSLLPRFLPRGLLLTMFNVHRAWTARSK
jgi:uncharacterized protein